MRQPLRQVAQQQYFAYKTLSMMFSSPLVRVAASPCSCLVSRRRFYQVFSHAISCEALNVCRAPLPICFSHDAKRPMVHPPASITVTSCTNKLRYSSQFQGIKHTESDKPRRFYTGKKRHNYKRQQWNVKDCSSVDELLNAVIEKLDDVPPSTIAAVWNYFPVLLRAAASKDPLSTQNEDEGVNTNEAMIEQEHQVAFLVHQTLQRLDVLRPKELSIISLSMAKIIQILHHNNVSSSISHQAFRNVLLDDTNNPREHVFYPLAEAAYFSLHKFDARCLSNLAYAHTLMRYNPQFANGALMDFIAHEALHHCTDFAPQGISCTLWAFAKSRIQHPLLFRHLGDYVVNSAMFASLDPRALSMTLWAFATANEEHKVLFQKAGDAILNMDLGQFSPQEISNIMWAFATSETEHAELYKCIGDHVTSMNNLRSFAPQALSITVWSYAKAGNHHSGLLAKVAKAVMQRGGLQDFHSQALANITWAFATCSESHPELFDRIAGCIITQDRLRAFNPQEISNTIWAYATAGMKNEALFQQAGDMIASKDSLRSFDPQNFSNILWAFATAGLNHDDMFQRIGDSIVASGDLRLFIPQEITNTVWAYATLDAQHSELFKRVGDVIAEKFVLGSFKPQELSSLLWAFAKANESHPLLFKLASGDMLACDNMSSFKPQELGNIIWAYARLGQNCPELFKRIGDEIVTRDLSAFTPQNVSNTVWAFATAGVEHPELHEKVAAAILMSDDLESFSPQAISNILWAYARANIYHPDLYTQLGNVIMKLSDLNSFKPQELSNLVWAYSTVNEIRPDIMNKVGRAIVEGDKLPYFTAQGISNIAWSFAVADAVEPTIFNDQFVDVLVAMQDEFTNETLNQLHQWHLWWAGEKSAAGLPDKLRIRCHQKFIEPDVIVSGFQRDVVQELMSIGLVPNDEYLTNSGYRLDVLVEVNGKQIGIECDGPSHFTGRKINGSTALKHRQVAALDSIEVVSIPYWDWHEFGQDEEKKQAYLRSLLRYDA